MIVSNELHIESREINSIEVKNAAMKVLVGADEGWTDHVMRIIELGPNGFSPKHAHDWPHINYMLDGQGELTVDGQVHTVEKGGYAYVPAGKEHQFKNTGNEMFRFICIVPKRGHL